MPKSEIEILEQIDLKLESLVAKFVDSYKTKVSKEIEELVLDFIDTLGRENDLTKRLERNKLINKFRAELESSIVKGVLFEAYKTLIVEYKELVTISNEYFSLLSTKYDKLLYKEIYKESILFLKESLVGAGVSQYIVNPIVDKIYTLNNSGISHKKLKEFIKEYFEKNNITQRYVEQVTTDSLYQITSNYQMQISADLNIKYYYYSGTKMKTSRSFCIARYGKAFTKEEAQSWADLVWQGKIVGTDKNSIFYYRGGYNCRHTLRPISKSAYNYLKGNEK